MISQDIFDELVRSAAIELQPEERTELFRELNSQMEIIRQLDAIPLDDMLPPVVHGNPYPPHVRCDLRQDEWIPFDNAAGILAQAPVSKDRCFVSPDVPHQRIG